MPTVAPPLLVPTQSDLLTSLRAFLLDVLPSDVEVIIGQQNRVPEPASPRFAVMTPIRFQRLATNFGQGFDVKFTGSVTGNLLNVTAVQRGPIILGSLLYGIGLVGQNIRIMSQASGPIGGTGVYQLSASPDVSSETLSSGYWQYRQPAKVTVQLDFHSADATAGDLAQAVATVFRSDYGVRFFAALGPDVTPLYADDPAQRPFTNDQNQVEWRWVLDACLQVNDITLVGQQFADAVTIGLIEVDSHYPP